MKSAVGFSLLSSVAASPLWPEPVTSQLGTASLTLSADFTFKQEGSESSSFLTQAIDRYVDLISSKSGESSSAVMLSATGESKDRM